MRQCSLTVTVMLCVTSQAPGRDRPGGPAGLSTPGGENKRSLAWNAGGRQPVEDKATQPDINGR